MTFRIIIMAAAVCAVTTGSVIPGRFPDGNGISAKHVNGIVVDQDNIKWFSTDTGIVSFDGESWILHELNEQLPAGQLKGIVYVSREESNELWMASPGGAIVARLPLNDPSGIVTYQPENSPILSKDVVSIAAGDNAIRWIGTDLGVSALRGDKWLSPDYEAHYPQRLFQIFPITSMATSPDGDSLYVGTAGSGVARVYADDVDGISGASVIAQWGPIELPSDYVLSIFIAPDATKWFGTEEGVASHTGENTMSNWNLYTEEDGLVNNFVQAIGMDQSGQMWFGTAAGISVFNGTAWTSYTTENGLISNNVLSLATDQDGIIWIGTEDGICSYENGKFTSY